VRLVAEHRSEYRSEWAALESIAAKIGCTAMTLRPERHEPTSIATLQLSALTASR
jgi:transposase